MPLTTDSTPAFLHSLSPLYFKAGFYPSLAAPPGISSGVWPTASLALYLPFQLPTAYACARAYVVNGAAVSGNFDVGIYNEDFSLVTHSGSTAHAGTNGNQYVAMVQTLAAGSYYLALVFDNTTAQVFESGTVATTTSRLTGILQQAAAFPLTSPMVPVTPTNAYWPVFGLTRTASGF